MTETVYYWPRGDMILILEENLPENKYARVWHCDDTNFYWSDILDHIDEFVLIGEL